MNITTICRTGIVTLLLFVLAGCAATIFRTPQAKSAPASNLAMITIPNNILLVRINNHRYGRCYADVAKQCAVQLVKGEYTFEVKIIETNADSRKPYIQTFNTQEESLQNSDIIVVRNSVLNSDIYTMPATIKANTIYGFQLDSKYNINIIEYMGAERTKILGEYKNANYKDLRLSSNDVLGYIVE